MVQALAPRWMNPIFCVVLVWSFHSIRCDGCAALSLFSSSSVTFLAKTKESFKLAELQLLEASLQAKSHGYGLKRLVLDRSTGSSLFRLNATSETNDNNVSDDGTGGSSLFQKTLLNKTKKWPSSLRRCDWVAEVLYHAATPEDLMEQIRRLENGRFSTSTEAKNDGDLFWTLDYVRLEHNTVAKKRPPSPRVRYTMKSLLYTVAQALPPMPALHPMAAKQQFLIVDVQEAEDHSFYFVKLLTPPNENRTTNTATTNNESSDDNLHQASESIVLQKWANRPFQYSSSINFNLAGIIMDMLSEMVLVSEATSNTKTDNNNILLLDPTCGSGTFLALGLERGFQRLEGYDINPKCVQGTIQNLVHVFGDEAIQNSGFVSVTQQDSTFGWNRNNTIAVSGDATSTLFSSFASCVVANLPWGVNSILYQDENLHILKSVQGRLVTDAPCAFVTRDAGEYMFEQAGFEVLGQAHVPPRDFSLPRSKKVKTKACSNDKSGSRCVITIARFHNY